MNDPQAGEKGSHGSTHQGHASDHKDTALTVNGAALTCVRYPHVLVRIGEVEAVIHSVESLAAPQKVLT